MYNLNRYIIQSQKIILIITIVKAVVWSFNLNSRYITLQAKETLQILWIV